MPLLGVNDIPGTIVSVETAPEGNAEAEAETSEPVEPETEKPPTPQVKSPPMQTPRIEVTHILDEQPVPLNNNNVDVTNLPPIVWVNPFKIFFFQFLFRINYFKYSQKKKHT